MSRWSTLIGLALLACGQTQGHTPAPSSGGTGGGNAGSGGASGGGTGSGGQAGSPDEFLPRKPIPCGTVNVPAEQACDGKIDCQLGNDEAGCPLYFCKDGSSRTGRTVCDGEPDCPEAEDEADDQCSSVPTGFVCEGRMRVPRRNVCDGKADCENGADEAVCPAFLCTNGAQAIAQQSECDRVEDCDDGSDERNCLVP